MVGSDFLPMVFKNFSIHLPAALAGLKVWDFPPLIFLTISQVWLRFWPES
jgi:hypothetical protein